jgi:superfamily II DNA or RNA helicase
MGGHFMPWKCERIHEAPLQPTVEPEQFALHLAALEWSLSEAIVLHSAEDIQSRRFWRDRLEPFQHQIQNLFTFCRRLPVTLLADDVGLGKTICAGLIMSELMVRRRVHRTLILCPKILGPQWVEELIGKFGIAAKEVSGKQLARELTRSTPVLVTTYDSARKYLSEIEPQTFDLLILDEAHKLRNLYGTQKPPVLAQKVRNALEQRLFRFVVMLTATPIHNRLWDIYSLLDCLTVAKGHKNPLGKPKEFRSKFLLPGSDGRKLNPLAADEFRGILKQYVVRTRRNDARLKFPSRKIQLFRVKLSAEENRLNDLVAQHIQHLNPLQQISLAQAMMSSPQALAAQMKNMAGKGSLPPAAAAEARIFADRIAMPAKLERLLKFLRELKSTRPDWRVVVFTIRKETQESIGRTLHQIGIPFGFIQGGESRQNQLAIEKFREEPPKVHVLISTDAGSEGINLQVANILFNYDLPWNPMIVEQRIGRLQRLASKFEHVVIGNLVAEGSVEERIVGRLLEKLQGIAQAIGDIESILESAGWEGDNLANSFENQLRELVIKALRGQDVEEATRLKLQSIEMAQREIEERRQEIDTTLGQLDVSQQTGPRTPKLSRVSPSISDKDFILRAKQAEGARVELRPDGAYEASLKDHPTEVMIFEEETADKLTAGTDFSLYQPGKPAFERSVQHWVERGGQLLRELTPHTKRSVSELAQDWCRTIEGAEFRGCETLSRHKAFQGCVRVKAKASNGVDSYEKLLQVPFPSAGREPLRYQDRPSAPIEKALKPSELLPSCSNLLKQAVEADKDIGEFCRFYEDRQKEETVKAGNDRRRQRKIVEDFAPSVVADVVGIQGVRYEEVEVRVQFALDGKHVYTAHLIAVPDTDQIVREPGRKMCQETKRSVPESCLAVCGISGLLVLQHHLESSQVSGRRALPRYLAVCQVTGQKVLQDELATSSVSGKQALASLFRPSLLSGRLGLPEDFARCEITDREVLRDELIVSAVSGKRFVRAEMVRSSVSNTIGHSSEFIDCRATGLPILPSEAGKSAWSGKIVRKDYLAVSEKPPGRLGLADEFGVCAATGKRLLRDELGQSAVSGKWFDVDLLRPSQFSGKLALEGELEQCAATYQWVLPEELETCAVTGKRALRTRMLQSDVSHKFVLKDRAVRSAFGNRVGLPEEAVECAWLGKPILRDEAQECRLTRLLVAKTLLNDRGELKVLRDLLDGRALEAQNADDLVPRLKLLGNNNLKGLKHLQSLMSPDGSSMAVCGEIRTFLGFKTRYVGLLLKHREHLAILGRYAIGYRKDGNWVLESQS